LFSILANGLGDGQNVPFVEGPFEGRPPVAGSAKGHPLRGSRRIGQIGVIRGNQPRHINQDFSWGGFSRKWAYIHTVIQFPEANSRRQFNGEKLPNKTDFIVPANGRCNGLLSPFG
jgi:hypothetical protein